MKIVNRIVKAKIEVNIIDNNEKTYILKEKYVLLYVFSWIAFIFAGLIAVVVLGLPRLLSVEIEIITIILLVILLIPFLIFGVIPKDKKYLIVEKKE